MSPLPIRQDAAGISFMPNYRVDQAEGQILGGFKDAVLKNPNLMLRYHRTTHDLHKLS